MESFESRRGSHDADVIVVGGGPAGASAALTLARRGVSTLVLDRHRFPRDKPCGGGIRYSVFRRFPGLAEHLRSTAAVHEIRKVLMEAPSGARVLAELDAPLYATLRRIELDAALLARARAAGAEVIEDARITGLSREREAVVAHTLDGRSFRGRVLIGADGVNSVVARAAGLTTGFADDAIAIDAMEETPLADLEVDDAATIYVAYGYRGWAGYGYVFPKAHHIDAGVGVLVSYYKQSLGASPWELYQDFLADAVARGVVRGTSRRENFKAYRLPLGGPLPRTYDDRILLAGDAGGFVNGYTGEGIYHAMVTGELAGETAADAVAAGETHAMALARYQVRWQAEIGEELTDSVRIQRRLFANPRLADRIIRAASFDRTLCRRFALVALGEARARDRKLEMACRFAIASLRAWLAERVYPRRHGGAVSRRLPSDASGTSASFG